MSQYRKSWIPVAGKDDPCPPLKEKTYETPPNLYVGFQVPGLKQFKPAEALKKGTLWPDLFGPYDSPFEASRTASKKEEGQP